MLFLCQFPLITQTLLKSSHKWFSMIWEFWGKCDNVMVEQWLRICLPMQETRVRALVWEDPKCHGTTKPVCHNYWACALEPVCHNYWACTLEPMSHNYWACALEPAHHNYWACALEPASRNYWSLWATTEACAPRARAPNKRSHHNEKPAHCNEE